METPHPKRGAKPPQGLHVRNVAVYRGPHLFSRTRMVHLQVDLGALEHFPTNQLPGFGAALIALLPGLKRHGCCYGEPGGFLRRLEEGTWLGHVAEHVAIALQNMAGADVARGKTRSVKGMSGVYNILFEYETEPVGLLAGRFALECVETLLPAELRGLTGTELIAASPLDHFDLAEAVANLCALRQESAFGPTTASLVGEAEARGIPWRRMDSSSLVQFGYGKHIKRIRASCTSHTSEIAAEIASDKELTKTLLDEAGLPVPRGMIVTGKKEAIEASGALGFPVVAKPVDGNHGRGVNVGLTTVEEVAWGFEQARLHSREILIEQQFEGDDHRLLVIGGKVVAAARRMPAHVVGDGKTPIEELIKRTNEDPRRGEGHGAVLTKIAIDPCLVHYIGRSGLTLSSTPAMGHTVTLLPTANLSTGGTAIDCTDIVHPDNATIACRAAQIVGLDIAGIDLVTPDISRSVLETGGGIIEVNAGPGFRMHLAPSQGLPRNVAAPVLDLLYPAGAKSRIPILAVTGTNGKTTTTRMVAHILSASGRKVGLSSSAGVYIDGRRIMAGDCTGPRSARVVLGDPTIDVAVLETARGGLLREGLAFDACDVGCVTNVSADHLGLRGIDCVEDLAAVKSVVVETVQREGWSVLNADNRHTLDMREEAGGSLCFFSTRSPTLWPDVLKRHVATGGRAFGCDLESANPTMMFYEQGQSLRVMDISEIPATFNGMAAFNVENAVAAAAVAYCNGISLPVIRQALQSFGSSFEQSAGRLNVTERGGFRTIVDYAHNPDGLRALGVLVEKMKSAMTSAIGVVSIAGDRRDQDIVEMGKLAGSIFDRLILKEDKDLRGRSPGEVTHLLRQGALASGVAPGAIEVILDELPAVEHALQLAQKGDLVVITADDVDGVWACVSTHGFEPVGNGAKALAPVAVSPGMVL